MHYVARKVLFHHGKRIMPGEVVEDAPQWRNFPAALERGLFEAADDVVLGEVAQVEELPPIKEPEAVRPKVPKRRGRGRPRKGKAL